MPENETDSTRLLTIRLSPDTHRALRIRVAEEDTSMQKWVVALIEEKLGIESRPENRDEQREGG